MNCKLASLEEERLVYLSDSHTRIKDTQQYLLRILDGQTMAKVEVKFTYRSCLNKT